FTYDAVGNLVGATNRDARVRRGYYPGGDLRGDTLTIRTWAELSEGGNFTSHVYGLEFFYDRNGRRTEVKHPSNVAPLVGGVLKDRTAYAYDRQTGALATVTDPLGTSYRYQYNARGEVETLTLPGGITESYRYDPDGRLALHQTLNASTAADRYAANPLRRDTLGYDARGKLLFSRNGAGAADTLTASYSPMGYLTYSRTESNGAKINNATPTSEVTEQPRYDALGNQISRSTQSSFDLARYGRTTTVSEVFRYQPGTGRLRAKNTAVHGDTLVYDAAGNLVWETYTTPGLTASDDFRDHAYFYDAGGRLRAADVRTVDDPTNQLSNYSRAFEEYRYDALGRRVLVRARRECNQDQYSALCELGWLRRTIWDGDQELIEIQAPGGQQPHMNQYMENDSAHVNLALENGSPPDWYTIDPNPFYGRVLYVHGVSLDHPLALVRMGYGDRLDTANVDRGYRAVEPYVIVPHWNSRGQAVLGTYDDGGWRRCVWLNGYKRCNFLQWPEMWAGYARPDMRENAWHGTLLADKGDGSGLSYRRNRYYDPTSGRFTQEDPIGLAGGLNVYGFADGDPVGFGDPYGLCAWGMGPDAAHGRCSETDAKHAPRFNPAHLTEMIQSISTETGRTPEQVRRAMSSREGLVLPRGTEFTIGGGWTIVAQRGNVLRLSADGATVRGQGFTFYNEELRGSIESVEIQFGRAATDATVMNLRGSGGLRGLFINRPYRSTLTYRADRPFARGPWRCHTQAAGRTYTSCSQ
ncbi:MAG TPA: RHS repeat-associated core domain-containing protein, partial [Longimicrobium sp.]|nr:RHS repeat-associated core domain-containing protein [Longimicrobium sp.]